MWPGNLMEDLEKNRAPFSILCQALCIIAKPSVNTNCRYNPRTLHLGQNGWFFLCPVTSKFDGWPWKTIGHIFYAISSFVVHFIAIWRFKMELQSENAKFGSKSANFFVPCDLEIDGWPWKTIGHLMYATSSFVHHFIAIREFKLTELQSGNGQVGFWPLWSWPLTSYLDRLHGCYFCHW